MTRKRRDAWAEPAITKALKTGKKTWGELLKATNLSKGALSLTLRPMLTQHAVVTETDASTRPPRTIYALGNPTPFYEESPVVEKRPTMEEMIELAKARQSKQEQRTNISILDDQFLDSVADFVAFAGLLKASARTTLFLRSESDKRYLPGKPSSLPDEGSDHLLGIRWFQGTLQEAEQLIMESALKWAMIEVRNAWNMLVDWKMIDTKKHDEGTLRNDRQTFEKHLAGKVQKRLSEFNQSGVCRVMNKGAVGLVFFSPLEYVEHRKKLFEAKYRSDPFRSRLLALMTLFNPDASMEDLAACTEILGLDNK